MKLSEMIADAEADMDRVGHAVWHVMSELATGQITAGELTAEHPLIAQAVQVADAALEARGVPVKTIETLILEGVREALAAAKALNTPTVPATTQGTAP